MKVKKAVPFTGRDRPRVLQEGEASRIFRQSARKGGKVIGPAHRLPLPPLEDLC